MNPVFTQQHSNISRSVRWSQLVSVINLPDIQIKSRANQNKGHMLCLSICLTMHKDRKKNSPLKQRVTTVLFSSFCSLSTQPRRL